MRAALGSPQAITEVLDASKKIALNRYEKAAFDADGWQIMLSKHKVCAAASIGLPQAGSIVTALSLCDS
jgi:hypothetical protein